MQPHVIRDPDRGQVESVMGTGRCVEAASQSHRLPCPAVLP